MAKKPDINLRVTNVHGMHGSDTETLWLNGFSCLGDYSQEHLAFIKEHSLFQPTTARQINIFPMIVFIRV